MTPRTDTLEDAEVEEVAAHSRRAFLTRGAVGAAAAVAGGAALTALAASPAAAVVGSVVLLGTPVRVYDSRPGKTFQGEGANPGVIFTYAGPSTGSRQIRFGTAEGSDIIPDTADGALINLTITNTVSTGALAVSNGSAISAPAASLINWFGPSQILANASIIPVDQFGTGKSNANLAACRIWTVAGTPNVSACHFIVDCLGYVSGV